MEGWSNVLWACMVVVGSLEVVASRRRAFMKQLHATSGEALGLGGFKSMRRKKRWGRLDYYVMLSRGAGRRRGG